jgi:hypothetical protein
MLNFLSLIVGIRRGKLRRNGRMMSWKRNKEMMTRMGLGLGGVG